MKLQESYSSEFPHKPRTLNTRSVSFEKFPLPKVDYSIIIKFSVLVSSGSSNPVWWAGNSLNSNLAGGEILIIKGGLAPKA